MRLRVPNVLGENFWSAVCSQERSKKQLLEGVVDLAGVIDYCKLLVNDYSILFSAGLRLVCAAGGENSFLERVCYVEADA